MALWNERVSAGAPPIDKIPIRRAAQMFTARNRGSLRLTPSRCWRRPAGPILAAARHIQQATSGGNAQCWRQRGHCGDQTGSSLAGSGRVIPNSVARFFCPSIIISACASFAWRYWFSRWRRVSSAAWARVSGDGSARRLGSRPARPPWARCRRQRERCEEEMPSRRSKAPSSPGGQASAASRIRRRSRAHGVGPNLGIRAGRQGALFCGRRHEISLLPSTY